MASVYSGKTKLHVHIAIQK